MLRAKSPAPKLSRKLGSRALLGFRTRKQAMQKTISCRTLVLERRNRLAQQGAVLQGTDAECAYFLADLAEVEQEIALGVFRGPKRRRHVASAVYVSSHWQPGDPLAAALGELDELYKRC